MMPAVFQSLQDMDEQRVKMIQVSLPSRYCHAVHGGEPGGYLIAL